MQTQSSTASDLVVPRLPDQLPAGAKAGPWTIEQEIGRGGMGAVYAVVHESIGKRAALKLIHRRLLHPTHVERMWQEARIVNCVAHPNIVDIFETGTLQDGRAYIVMERLYGVSLARRVCDGHIMPDEVVRILMQVCQALIAAHAAGVVHRDLKTDNVFLCADTGPHNVKLLDWGIAKVLTGNARYTSEGHVVGTPQYLAPEQARAGAVSDRTDVYSLGVMAYELLLEQLPFEAETPLEVMTMHLRAVPPPPHELWPDIPPVLEALLLAMLAKDPAARPSAAEVLVQLGRIRDVFEARRGSSPSDASHVGLVRAQPHLATPAALAVTRPGALNAASRAAAARGWKYAVAAAAAAMLVAMFVLARESDSAAAASTPESARATLAASGLDVIPVNAVAATSVEHPPLPAAVPVVLPTPMPPLTRAGKPTSKPASKPAPRTPPAIATKRPAPRDPLGRHAAHVAAPAQLCLPILAASPPTHASRVNPNGTLDAY